MNCQSIIVTCPMRAGIFEQTRINLARVWPEPPHVQMDRSTSDDPKARQTQNFQSALTWFAEETNRPFVLILEDDLEFNAHLWWNIERWAPYAEEKLHFGSLYNPNVRAIQQGDDHFIADPEACYGSQSYLLSRTAVGVLLRDWDSIAGMQDIKITRILAKAGYPLFHHKPSLVQHVGATSAWGGGFHQASDYDPALKTQFTHERIPGWFTFPRLYEQAVASASDGATLVEVGAWLGRSTAFLGQTVRASGKRLNVVVVDTFRGSDTEPILLSCVQEAGGSIRPAFERNMTLAGIRDQLDVRQAASVEAAETMPDRSCSFVFIDADHRYEAVRKDIRSWLPKVSRGGILAGHDCYTYPDVYNAVRDELGANVTMTDENVWVHQVP